MQADEPQIVVVNASDARAYTTNTERLDALAGWLDDHTYLRGAACNASCVGVLSKRHAFLSAYICLAAALALELWLTRSHLQRYPLLSGDTLRLLQGTDAIRDCLSHGKFVKCGYPYNDPLSPYHPASTVNQYPLFQYLVVLASGLRAHRAFVFLAGLNSLSIFAMALFAYAIAKRNALWGLICFAIIVVSPYLFYANLGLGEPLAAFLVTMALWRLSRRGHPAELAFWFFVAGLTKETVWPFLLLGALFIHLQAGISRSRLGGVGLGVAASYVASGLFNVFRYGSWNNVTYGVSQYRIHSATTIIKYFISLFVAPNGGLAWFWPLFLIVPVAMLRVAWKGSRRDRAIAAVWLLTVVALTFVLSLWWAPFGWYGWGPRLFLGLLAPLAIVAIDYLSRRPSGPVVLPTLLVPFLVICALLLVPHLGARAHDGKDIRAFFDHRPPVCQGTRGGSNAPYVRCVLNEAWDQTPYLLVTGAKQIGQDGQPIELVLFVAAIGAFGLGVLRRRAVGEDGPDADGRSVDLGLPAASATTHASP
jgi:hypothetical protein